jgi:hypothetical protein
MTWEFDKGIPQGYSPEYRHRTATPKGSYTWIDNSVFATTVPILNISLRKMPLVNAETETIVKVKKQNRKVGPCIA